MSAPNSAQFSLALKRRPLIFASVAVALVVVGVIANFLTWRAFTFGAPGEIDLEN